MNNPLLRLEALGQSVWLDFIRRGMLTSGELRRLVEDDGLSGVTANPTIFEKAIGGSQDYDQAIQALAREGKNAGQIYEVLAVEDVGRAADLFRPIYDRTGGRDGFASLEVSPRLAHDTDGTIAEARRLWSELGRPNALIKVPATREGLPAIHRLIAEGINVNVTLLFGLPRYFEVMQAYVGGLEERVKKGLPVDRVASVASFFLSRIDVLADPMLEKLMRDGNGRGRLAERTHGQIAVASAKVAYQMWQEVFHGPSFSHLDQKGARSQRVLWASTGTKNPAYSDTKYVEPLIGPESINTMPIETVEAYRDHGDPHVTITQGVPEARQVLEQLRQLDIDLDRLTQQLTDEGVRKFDTSFDNLLQTIEQKSTGRVAESRERQASHPGS